jgi:hypothetical protein
MEQYWFGENRWEIYLPDGAYRLCLATRGIDDTSLPGAAQSTRIGAGRHVVALQDRKLDNGWRVSVLCDDKEVLTVDEPTDWNAGSGATSSGQGSPSEQLAPEQPVVLLRCRFMPPNAGDAMKAPEVAAEGMLLWIERVAGVSGAR